MLQQIPAAAVVVAVGVGFVHWRVHDLSLLIENYADAGAYFYLWLHCDVGQMREKIEY